MTKAEELEILKETIEKLKEDSYSGKWLAECFPEIKRNIESDLLIDNNINTFGQTFALCQFFLAKAREDADKIRKDAQTEAEGIVAKAREKAEGILNSVRIQLRKCFHVIDS